MTRLSFFMILPRFLPPWAKAVQHRSNLMLVLLLAICSVGTSTGLSATPVQDQAQLRQFYQQRFPELALQDYANGIYAIDPIARDSWEAIEEFPPYEPAIDEGENLFNTPFKNGKGYADCFPNGGIGIANEYPKWDGDNKEVVTLEKAINDCRVANDETPLPYLTGTITKLLAYMAYTSRGKPINIQIPADDPQALAAYQQGKKYYYQRRGQLNFSCAICHIDNAGKRIRSEVLSPMLGHTSSWPTYRLKWGEMGTLHRRFIGCHQQIRATPFPAQSREFRNLEFFLGFISNGIPINGPATRK